MSLNPSRRTFSSNPLVQRMCGKVRANSSSILKRHPDGRPARCSLFALALAQARRFALQAAQVVQLGAAHAAGAHDVDMVDHRSVQRENALDAGAEAGLANGDGLAHAGVIAADHGALEGLQAFLVAFPDLHVDADGVANPELRKVGALVLIQDLLQIGADHGLTPFLSHSTLRPRDPRRWRPADPVSAGSFSRAPPDGATCGSPRGDRSAAPPARSSREKPRAACSADNPEPTRRLRR